ncbi:hypothetical protein FACS1894109_10840 [Spirochaetia bacterium]|nr:hypothetical protein FACS1894109_10840 [Spirochaetia bacterium]
MKKFLNFIFMISAIVGFGKAQELDRSLYEETALSDYKIWVSKAQYGESKKFRAPVVFSGQIDTDLYFDDSAGENFTAFKAEKTWPAMGKNQQVTIYFTGTGQGPSVINDIDYNDSASANISSAPEPLPRRTDAEPAIAPTASAASRAPAEPTVSIIEASPRTPTAPAVSIIEASPRTPAAPAVSIIEASPRAPAAPAVSIMVPAAPRTPEPVIVPARPRAYPPAKILGSIPKRGSHNLYRLQVGSFLNFNNAEQAYNRLLDAGLKPAYENYGVYTRVVFKRIYADDVASCAAIIGAIGFPEIWCREER